LVNANNGRFDLMYLATHFSASTMVLALATDASLTALEVANGNLDLRNTIVFSAGCHSGYNIVNEHGLPGITREPDWAQVFAREGATLIANTGYQYGEAQFVQYGEALYRNFAQQLREGSGPVAVGDALARAKGDYLVEIGNNVDGVYEKSHIISTLYGLPMLSVNMPAGRNSSSDA
jgi:hypothetical protein